MVVLAIGPRTAWAQEDQDFLKRFALEIEQKKAVPPGLGGKAYYNMAVGYEDAGNSRLALYCYYQATATLGPGHPLRKLAQARVDALLPTVRGTTPLGGRSKLVDQLVRARSS